MEYAITYTSDNASRLTQIQQAAGASNNNVVQTIGFSYDDTDRRTRTTLGNGSSVNYAFDDASQVASITYRKADNSVIGDLTYAYDNAGRRSCVARPGDSLSNCSLRYTYHFASQPGELSWVETAERQDGAHRHQELHVSGARRTEHVARQNQGSRDRRAAYGEEKALPGPEGAMDTQRRNEGRDG